MLERTQSYGSWLGRQLGWLQSWLGVPMRRDQAIPGWAVISAGLAPLVLTAGWLAAGLLQPDSYSPMRQTVSSMAGYGATDRWVMTATLFVVGGCYLVTATGMTSLPRPARLLLIVAGLCSTGIATSPEPAAGPTTVHLAWTVIGAIALAIWPTVAGWPGPQRRLIMGVRGTAITTILFVILLGWIILETRGPGNDLGLAERMTSSIQTAWPYVVALAMRRAGGSRQPTPQSAEVKAKRAT